MVEIALSLAVVAFALVAIMGVLPTGMTVQRDNREDTLINQEGRYWLEAVKNGARGLEEITNYVESIKIEKASGTTNVVEFKNDPAVTPLRPADVIALLSIPKYQGAFTNRVTARVKPITGAAAERGSLTNEISFRYQIQVELVQAFPKPPPLVGDLAAAGNNPQMLAMNEAMGQNLWDVRLVLRWPVVERGQDFQVGNNRKTFRARVLGRPWPQGGESWRVDELSAFVTNKFPNLTVLSPNDFNVRAGLQ